MWRSTKEGGVWRWMRKSSYLGVVHPVQVVRTVLDPTTAGSDGELAVAVPLDEELADRPRLGQGDRLSILLDRHHRSLLPRSAFRVQRKQGERRTLPRGCTARNSGGANMVFGSRAYFFTSYSSSSYAQGKGQQSGGERVAALSRCALPATASPRLAPAARVATEGGERSWQEYTPPRAAKGCAANASSRACARQENLFFSCCWVGGHGGRDQVRRRTSERRSSVRTCCAG